MEYRKNIQDILVSIDEATKHPYSLGSKSSKNRGVFGSAVLSSLKDSIKIIGKQVDLESDSKINGQDLVDCINEVKKAT